MTKKDANIGTLSKSERNQFIHQAGAILQEWSTRNSASSKPSIIDEDFDINSENVRYFVQESSKFAGLQRQLRFGDFHHPFDRNAVEFFTNAIHFNGELDSVKFDSYIENALLMGSTIIYRAGDVEKIVDFGVPVYKLGNLQGYIYTFDNNTAENLGVEIEDGHNYTRVDVAGGFWIVDNTDTNVEPIFYGKLSKELPYFEIYATRDRMPISYPVYSLMKAYDKAQDNTKTYMDELVEAMLLINGGGTQQSQDISDEMLKNIGQMQVLAIQGTPDGASMSKPEVKYLHKEYDSTGSEAYKDRLKRDIYEYLALPRPEDWGSNVSTETIYIKLTTTRMRANQYGENLIIGARNFGATDFEVKFGFEDQLFGNESSENMLSDAFSKINGNPG